MTNTLIPIIEEKLKNYKDRDYLTSRLWAVFGGERLSFEAEKYISNMSSDIIHDPLWDFFLYINHPISEERFANEPYIKIGAVVFDIIKKNHPNWITKAREDLENYVKKKYVDY